MTLEKDIEKAFIAEFNKTIDIRSIPRASSHRVAQRLRKDILSNIAKGISPITGRRFPAYKNPKSYPGKRKPKRPVNLKLTGEFLRSLRTRSYAVGKTLTFHVFFNSVESQKKEQGHREGANGQPKRPIIPQANESFSERIMVELRKAIVNLFR